MPDEATEIHAVLSLLGRSMHFDRFPLPDHDVGPPLLAPEEAAGHLCGPQRCVTPSVKLLLLCHVAEDIGRQTCEPIAMSLIDRGRVEAAETRRASADVGGARRTWANALLDRIQECGRGGDPLGPLSPTVQDAVPASGSRPGADDEREEVSTLLDALVPDARDTSVVVSPTCEATTQVIDGFPALSLSTTIITKEPIEAVSSMTDPRFWPRCEPQSQFFKAMDVVRPPTALGGPDRGWSARLREVVDFSYGLNESDSSRMTTDLDFVHFESETAMGCTYDLHRSLDRRILVDRGFVMVEDLKGIGRRRTTTLKQVYFRTRPQPGDVCRFWSLAHGMVSTSCAMQGRPDAGRQP